MDPLRCQRQLQKPLFKTPDWQDLVIAEAHVRDLCALAPLDLTPEERRGFTGLKKYVESPDFYLHHLGVNCVELQPVQEFDNVTTEEYHWGYMTNNFFAPESSYALAPEKASGVKELQALVAAFHARGIAVILDVVFNHEGMPAHLMFIDRLYYFEQDANGTLVQLPPFLATTGTDPRRAFAQSLLGAIGNTATIAATTAATIATPIAGPILVYNLSFERGVLMLLADDFPDLAAQLHAMADRLFDLLPLVRAHYYHPAMMGSWSIKRVLPTIAPDLDYGNLDDVQSGDMWSRSISK